MDRRHIDRKLCALDHSSGEEDFVDFSSKLSICKEKNG